MPKAWCQGWGQEIEIPVGIKSGDLFDCPNWAGLTLRASEGSGKWTVREVKKASCVAGEEVVILPDDVQPGDIIECHGVRQRVTYEFGTYALVKLEGGWWGTFSRLRVMRLACHALYPWYPIAVHFHGAQETNHYDVANSQKSSRGCIGPGGVALVACLPASAEVPSAVHHNCAVITGEQFTLHKVSPRSLGAVAINPAVALIALWPSFCSLPAPT